MRFETHTPSDQQKIIFYRRLSSVVFVIYIATLGVFDFYPPGRFGTAAAAACGALFFGVILTSGMMVVHRMDEFQRALLTHAFLWATVATMGFASIYGYVEAAPRSRVPHLPLLIVPVILVMLTAATKVFFFRRNQAGNE